MHNKQRIAGDRASQAIYVDVLCFQQSTIPEHPSQITAERLRSVFFTGLDITTHAERRLVGLCRFVVWFRIVLFCLVFRVVEVCHLVVFLLEDHIWTHNHDEARERYFWAFQMHKHISIGALCINVTTISSDVVRLGDTSSGCSNMPLST